MKGCLEYVEGGVGDPPNLAAAWPQDLRCVTILDGDNKGCIDNNYNITLSTSINV